MYLSNNGLAKLAWNVECGEKQNSAFCLFLRLKITKIFVREYFLIFLTVHVYSTAHKNKTLTMHRKFYKDPNYVESFCVSTTVFELEAF
jgi:hypothetical protein